METDFEQLFRDAGAAHHQAYIETDGADPEWPLWYAHHLLPRIRDHVGELTESELVYHLVSWDRAYRAEETDQPWPAFYSQRLQALAVS